MKRMWAALFLCVACDAAAGPDVAELPEAATASITNVTRDHITGDVYHHGFLVRLGETPNAQIHIHRVVRETLHCRETSFSRDATTSRSARPQTR